MPAITGLTSLAFPDGSPLDPSFLDQMFGPSEIATAHTVVNGHLDGGNASSLLKVSAKKVRPRSCAFGKMEGLTGNFDFHGDKVFSKSHTNLEAYIPLPGAAISFYLPPEPPKLVLITWTVFGANATMFEKSEKDEKLTRMRFFINGESTEGTRMVPSSRHGHNGYDPVSETTVGGAKPHRAWRRPHRDRVWSGHFTTFPTTAGFDHIKPGWNHAWIGVHNEEQTARFRVRNMKAVWFY